MKNHYKSFFGKNCALIITSDYNTSSFYLNFIQEKGNQQWETYKEGLTLSLNLSEICDISEILEKDKGNKRIIHVYKVEKKDFWFGFEKKNEDWVFSIKGRSINKITRDDIRSHQKSFDKGELRLLKKLLFHIEDEFIEFTTKGKKNEK